MLTANAIRRMSTRGVPLLVSRLSGAPRATVISSSSNARLFSSAAVPTDTPTEAPSPPVIDTPAAASTPPTPTPVEILNELTNNLTLSSVDPYGSLWPPRVPNGLLRSSCDHMTLGP